MVLLPKEISFSISAISKITKLNLFVMEVKEKNRFTPGSNIKIISKELMRKLKPDYLFVLIWSFRKEVIQQEAKYLKLVTFVFPLPRFHLVNKFNYKEYLNKDLENFSYKY